MSFFYLPRLLLFGFLPGTCLAFTSCSQEPDTSSSSNNKQFSTATGFFVGHLKPEAGPPLGADGKPLPAAEPVEWIVSDGQVSKPKYVYDVHTFRLDFDEKEPLTDAQLAHVRMTEETHQIVVHRGPCDEVLTHADVADGQRCLPVFECPNVDCSRFKEIDQFGLSPIDPSGAKPKCRFCGRTELAPFFTPQHRDMKSFIERRAGKDAQPGVEK
jgi:hypothetical protein